MSPTEIKPKIALIQVRKDQAMKDHELACFLKSGSLAPADLVLVDLVAAPVGSDLLDRVQGVIVGGSGDYSVNDDVPNADSLAELLRGIVSRDLPFLGACWGAQFLARLFGGEVAGDDTSKELGTVIIEKNADGDRDPLLFSLPRTFAAQAGHNDSIVRLPDGATLLASSVACENQAFRMKNRVYGVQFHPELSRQDLELRIRHYQKNYASGDEALAKALAALQDSGESAKLVEQWLSAVVYA